MPFEINVISVRQKKLSQFREDLKIEIFNERHGYNGKNISSPQPQSLQLCEGQSVRYQQFIGQAEQPGLYGTDREEYIRFLRTVYGSLEYGRADGLSGMSYTDAERMAMYGFDESPERFSEKILYQQGYAMGRAEREAWGMIAVISIMK